MAITTEQPRRPPPATQRPGRLARIRHAARGRTASTSATSSSATTPRTTATPRSWPAPRARTDGHLGSSCRRCSREERAQGRLRRRRAHARRRSPRTRPATSTRTNEIIVGLQTDAPLKRAIMPIRRLAHGRGRAEDLRLRAGPGRSRRSSPSTARPTTTASSTSTRRTSAPRGSSHIITGLPDAYGRGRIIGDYRRVALYGVDALIEAKKLERAELDMERSTRGRHPRARGDRRADPRPRRAQDDGGLLRLRHLRPGRPPAARPCSGCTSPTWAR